MTLENFVLGLFFSANILSCIAYLVRDMLYLRALTILACLSVIPYFLIQDEPLYTPVFWQSTFIAINLFNLAVLLHRMRPIQLSEREQRLHLMVFNIMKPIDMLELVKVGEWRHAKPGDLIVEQGEYVDGIAILLDGGAHILVNKVHKATLLEGDFVGEMSFITGASASADVEATSDATYIYWDRIEMDGFFHKHDETRDLLQAVMGKNMAQKLRRTHHRELTVMAKSN